MEELTMAQADQVSGGWVFAIDQFIDFVHGFVEGLKDSKN